VQRLFFRVQNLSDGFPQEQKSISIVLNRNASELNGRLVDEVRNLVDVVEDLIAKDIANFFKMPELNIDINCDLGLAH
jgi:hypothetical protein